MFKILLIIFALLLVTLSCTKKSPTPAPALSTSPFPNAVGNTYTYQVVDSNLNSKYQVQVTVAGTITLKNGLTASVWVYKGPASIDTNYVANSGDSTVFYDKSKLNIVSVYHFPLQIGKKYKNSSYNDSTKIISSGPLVLTSSTYLSSFYLYEHASGFNYKLNRRQWISPNIGLLKQALYIYNLGPEISQSWELISYHLNQK